MADMAEEYTADIGERIWADVQKVWKSFCGPEITIKDINKALTIVEAHPYGEVTLATRSDTHSVYIGSQKTELYFSWYTRRGKKWIRWEAEVLPASTADAEIIEYQDRESAWISTFPDRYEIYATLVTKRKLKRQGYILPPKAENVYAEDTAAGMVVIGCQMPDRLEEIVWYLCSPLGYAQVEHYTGSVISAAKKVGINLPDDAKTWEDVEPAWIMAQLRKL